MILKMKDDLDIEKINKIKNYVENNLSPYFFIFSTGYLNCQDELRINHLDKQRIKNSFYSYVLDCKNGYYGIWWDLKEIPSNKTIKNNFYSYELIVTRDKKIKISSNKILMIKKSSASLEDFILKCNNYIDEQYNIYTEYLLKNLYKLFKNCFY